MWTKAELVLDDISLYLQSTTLAVPCAAQVFCGPLGGAGDQNWAATQWLRTTVLDYSKFWKEEPGRG